MPAFACRNGRVSREVAPETQLDLSVLLMGSQIPAAAVAVAHALFCLEENRKDPGLYACFRPRLLSLTATVGYLEKSHQKV
jgi:hypothetical protein